MKHIVIIGSGPAGCYLADHLLRLMPDASIDILEQLPVPFGLIRYGVAPDHQSTKVVVRLFDRVLGRDQVSFFGNVEVGRDVSLDGLMSLYDSVVLAIGAERDRKLGIAGEELPGVIGSGAFVGWYNSHPKKQAPLVADVRSAIIIGNGNVAIDVARILAKSPAELAGSDVSQAVSAWLASQPLETVHIVGRRGAAEAKFTDHELAELGSLQRAQPVVASDDLSGETVVVRTLRRFADSPRAPAKPISIQFHFNLTPAAFLGAGELQAVQFRAAGDDTVLISAQLAITCIGYETVSCSSAAAVNGVFPNQDGKVTDRLYVVGWAKRGPSGTIPTNRVEAQQVAQKIARETVAGNRPGRGGLRDLLRQRLAGSVDYDGWRRIDAAELARAGAERCREKFSKTDDMLEAARAGELRPA
jgi:NADPH-dependent glutamate synthase beta subunit-like oxidoreductase